ncbi:hypothetical protein JYQ62_01445 [Nostoc sp. UHCC 0702]|nr:hypothetical protein JYQ62_01445 [Nostoc sp. UHCC 0702]
MLKLSEVEALTSSEAEMLTSEGRQLLVVSSKGFSYIYVSYIVMFIFTHLLKSSR